MKIYNKKGFMYGLAESVLGGGLFIITAADQELLLAGRIEKYILACILLAVGISSFIRAFSAKYTKEDLIEEKDERNKLVLLKTKARMLDLMLLALTGTAVAGLTGYILTRSVIWGAVFLVPALMMAFYWVTYIIINVYYEKHE